MARYSSPEKNLLQSQVRQELNEVLAEHGIQATFMAQTLGWNRDNFFKFKNGSIGYSEERLKELKKLLDKYKAIG